MSSDTNMMGLCFGGSPSNYWRFTLDRWSLVEFPYLTKCSTKEELDIFEFNKEVNKTVFILQSFIYDKKVAAIFLKVFYKGLAIGVILNLDSKFRYMTHYCEWIKDVLSQSKEVLERIRVYDTVFASLFTYDINEKILRAFCDF